GAPRIYILLSESRDLAKYDLRSIEWFLSGSAPLPVEVMRRFEELTGGKVLEGYGLTEAAPVTHSNPREGVRKPGSVGIPLPDVDCRIVDIETGTREVSQGEVVKAFVVLRPAAKTSAQELMDHCRANLAPYKVPVEIVFRTELPKTLIGKVLRRQLAAEEPSIAVVPLPRAG